MRLKLIRTSIERDGAFGELYDPDSRFICFTLERTYDPGNTIKIPPGVWQCKPSYYYRGQYRTFEIIIPGHSEIKIHKANVEIDLDGCIGLGMTIGMLGVNDEGRVAKSQSLATRYVKSVLQSKRGFDLWWKLVENERGFELEVKNPPVRELRAVNVNITT